MSDLIDRQAFIENERKLYCEDCDRRKGTKNGKPNVICYEIGEVPCRACWLDDALDDLEDFPAASPWHRVEDELPEPHKDVLVSGMEAINNSRVYKVMVNDDGTWRPMDYAPSIIWDYWMPIGPPKEDA